MADIAARPPRVLRRIGVLGAGAMGSRIAAHFANAGLQVVLLDMADAAGSNHAERNRITAAAVEALKKSKPPALYLPAFAERITIGNFDDDLPLLAECDWVIEAVAEDLAIKRSLIARAAAYRRADAIFTTNTSGLPVASIAAEMPEEFRRHWFGTHFFNPPRYMRLLEIIPTPESNLQWVSDIAQFAAVRLGKCVVMAHDSPNFIANRIGTFNLMNIVRIMMLQGLTVEEVDALTGQALGWPKTGTFRLCDLVGLDVLAHVADNFAQQTQRIGDERGDVTLPDFFRTMLQNRWLGDKTGQGFYRKEKAQLLAFDWKTLEYHAAAKPNFAATELAKPINETAERIKTLLWGDARKDKAAAFYWPMLAELWNYSANRIGEVAEDIVAIDRAMAAGFNWELGPFEMWDACGVQETVARMRAEGQPVAANVEKLLAGGHTRWYIEDASLASGRRYYDPASNSYLPVETAAGETSLAAIKKSNGVVKKNSSVSLVDIGDGVACIEFRSKMNSLGGDIVNFVTQTLRADSDAVKNFEAFVITNEGVNFSVGANLMQLLLAMQDGEWDEVTQAIRSFQGMTQAIKFCPRPVVVAPFGMALGGGTEVAIHGAARQAHAELYSGLVECSVGVIPGGGGCKETTLRIVDEASQMNGGRADSVEMFDGLKIAFETIAMARVSSSAEEARSLGYLRGGDGITMNRRRLLNDAANRARAIARAGYTAPLPRTNIAAPGANARAMLQLAVYTMRQGEFISDHDAVIGNHLAHILCGGNVPAGTLVSEQYLLELEIEAFVSLCGEKKTQERIAHTLKTGKPLRN